MTVPSELLLHILALPLIPVALATFLLLGVFRLGIRWWLWKKLGHKFGGLFISADKVYTPKFDISRKIVLILVYFRCDYPKNVAKHLSECLQQRVFDCPEEYVKLTSTHHSFLGQEYLIKNQVTLKDILKPLPLPQDGAPLDTAYMQKIAGEISNKPLPKNDAALWEVFYTNETMANSEALITNGKKGYVYPVLIKVHHALADGIRCAALMTTLFSYNQNSNYSDTLIHQDEGTFLKSIVGLIKQGFFHIHMALIAPVTFLKVSFFKPHDENAIHGCELSGEKLVAWIADDGSRHLKTVKKIKNKIPNTKFSDVVFTCISASIRNYFLKKHYEIPDKISCLLPILLSLNSKSRIELKNEFTFGPLELPLVGSSNLLDGLEKVKTSMNKMKSSREKDVLYWILNYLCGPVPGPAMNFLLNTSSHTMIITSVPGISGFKVLGDCDLLNIFTSAPHTNYTGITLCIFTYDNKFHMGLFVDKAIIPEQGDIQSIVEDIFNNIDELDKACERVYQSDS